MSTATLPPAAPASIEPAPGSGPGQGPLRDGLPREIPPELDRWNWGAFLLNWIWGLGNNTFLALLVFAPFIGFVMPFVLGAKGSAWAWRNGRWTSVEHFQRVQRKWAIWGLVAMVGSIALFGLLILGVFLGVGALLNDSEPYKLAVARVQASPQATERLGAPITAGSAGGSMKTDDGRGDGSADMTFTATGPKGSGRVALKAVRDANVWRLTSLRLTPSGQDQVLDIVRPEASLTNLRFKTSSDGEAKTTFKVGDAAVLLQFDVSDVPAGTTFVADWTKLKDEAGEEDNTFYQSKLVLDDASQNLISFTITIKGGWQAGKYRVTVSGDGIPPKSATFTVAP